MKLAVAIMLNGKAKYGNLNLSRMLLKALHMNWLEKKKGEFFYETSFIAFIKIGDLVFNGLIIQIST